MDKSKESPDLDRIGLFKEMSYHHEYVPAKISFNDPSKKGKQMMTNCSRSKAGTQDGYFDKAFQRAFEGEAYCDRIRLNRLYRLQKAEKNKKPCFQYSSPTREPSGKGSNYGTFEDYVRKLEYFSSKPRADEKSAPPKKNFFVNPAKKGTGYGYPNLTIGKQPSYFLQPEYEELKNAYEELKSGKREPKKPKPRPFEPYRAGLYQQKYFDPNPYRADVKSGDRTEQESEKLPPIKTPFKPSSPAKKDGGMKAGCLNPFPEHSTDIFPRIDLVPRGVKRYVNAENQMFRPVPGVKPYPVKSIINKNVQKRINSSNFPAIKGVVYCNESSWKRPLK